MNAAQDALLAGVVFGLGIRGAIDWTATRLAAQWAEAPVDSWRGRFAVGVFAYHFRCAHPAVAMLEAQWREKLAEATLERDASREVARSYRAQLDRSPPCCGFANACNDGTPCSARRMACCCGVDPRVEHLEHVCAECGARFNDQDARGRFFSEEDWNDWLRRWGRPVPSGAVETSPPKNAPGA
jgi:hypothetical protein